MHLTEAPVLDRVAFEGNKKVKDADLTAAIESKPRGTLQRAAVQTDVGRIIEAYRHVGRDEVSVVPQIIDRGNGRVDLVYAITEGAKTTVRQINFTGNQAFGKRQLGAVIKTSATNMLSFPDRRRRLRPRPHRAGSRAAQAVLPQQGLRGRQRDPRQRPSTTPARRDLH